MLSCTSCRQKSGLRKDKWVTGGKRRVPFLSFAGEDGFLVLRDIRRNQTIFDLVFTQDIVASNKIIAKGLTARRSDRDLRVENVLAGREINYAHRIQG
jgi:hypothetical protein